MLFTVILTQAANSDSASTPSVATFGKPAKSVDFQYFDYVAPDAPKGGTVKLGTRVSFDTTNGLRFPGKTPNELAFIYDTLMVRAEDEPASFYGLLAERVDLSKNYSEIEFTLRRNARWHDDSALMAGDVAFTFETLARHGLPSQRNLLGPVTISVVSDSVVRFTSAGQSDWRLFELLATFPIHQKRFWSVRDVGERTLDIPVGSGPYSIRKLDQNRQTILERVDNYWAAELPVNRGRWNFDLVVTDYYADANVLTEAVRGGQLDMHREYSPINWLNAYDGPALTSGKLVRSSFDQPLGVSTIAIVFNVRNETLNDRRVREALSAVFDSAYVRESFFGNLYLEPAGYYAQAPIVSDATDPSAELQILRPFEAFMPSGIFDAPTPPSFGSLSERERIRHADELLSQAGYELRDGVRINVQTGDALTLTYVGANNLSRNTMLYFARALNAVGIDLDVQYYPYTVGRRIILDHEWDLTTIGTRTRFPPGGDERVYWHSERANEPGYALAGVQDPALDAAIEAMTDTSDEDKIAAAMRAFSRVLDWQRYWLPVAQNGQIWIAHQSTIRFPENLSINGSDFVSYLWKAPDETD